MLFMLSAVALADTPTYIWNYNNLVNLKANTNSPLYKSILAQANAISKAEPMTVVNKTTCRSGDKHNYESLSIYYWQNPDDPQGPYIYKDGYYNPEFKNYDFPALDKLITYTRNLSVAYFITGNENYYKSYIRQIDTWFINEATKMNPNFEYSQFIPGRNNGKGCGAGLIDAYNFIDVIESIRLVNSIHSIGEARMSKLKLWFASFAQWMDSSSIGQEESNAKNNHGTAFDISLYAFYSFSESNPMRCSEIVKYFATKRIDTQFEGDGRQPLELNRTCAFKYSIFNLQHILDFYLLLKHDNRKLSSRATKKIEKSLLYLSTFIGRKEAFPYKEIGNWNDNEQNLQAELTRYYRASGKRSFRQHVYPASTDNLNLYLK